MSRDQMSDVAVIGAGVTGLSTAFRLMSLGAGSVTVFERERIAAQASGVQPGGVRQQWGTEVNCRMAREAFFFYRDLREHLESRIDVQLELCGYVFLAESPGVFDQLEANVALQKPLGIPSEMLTPQQVEEVVPDIDRSSVVGAAYCSEDGYFDKPQGAVEAFAEAAIRQGAKIRYAEVRSLAVEGDGWRLDLGDGSTAWADQVVMATGYDSPVLMQSLGVELPIRTEPRYLFFSDPISERLLDPLVVALDRQFAAKQLADGRLLASDLSATGEDDGGPDAWKVRVREHADTLLPRLQFVTFPLLVEGFYDMTPDGQPILGPVDGLDGLWIAAGFSGHGFMMAPVVSDRIARAILFGEHAEEFDVFSLERFQRDRLTPEPQVF